MIFMTSSIWPIPSISHLYATSHQVVFDEDRGQVATRSPHMDHVFGHGFSTVAGIAWDLFVEKYRNVAGQLVFQPMFFPLKNRLEQHLTTSRLVYKVSHQIS